jgi:leukotriene-A4 hydrolase
VDNSTYANAYEIHTTHFHVDWEVDFNTKQLIGSVTHDLEVLQATDHVTFDSWNINILSAELLETGSAMVMKDHGIRKAKIASTPLSWENDIVNPIIGDALTVYFGEVQEVGTTVSVRISYTTNPDAQAFSWLEPSQTAGGVLPYFYTQCEDINCRTVAPLQDTPSNRVTYSAQVITPNNLVAKMSANETGLASYNATHNIASFYCAIPIPDYLLAIAVGDLVYRNLGTRVGVITEPSQMDFVATELAEMQILLDTTEAYIGSYIWGNYTILVLPPSFPMGGMENPLLTFASPTIIVGDKSQVYVATHEMVHSWTGNTVTCSNWESFWLNEGFTVFIERKVSGILNGEDFSLVEANLGNTSMW